MVGVDVLAKLCKLKANLDGLSADDKAFVNSMVKLHESEQLLNRHQLLRIVDMRVPGEPDQDESRDSTLWSQGTVRVVNAPLEAVIWRYMPLEQLIALLWKKTIHFSPLSMMEDITEGQLPPRAWQETKKQLPESVLEGRDGMGADAMMRCMVEQRRTDGCISCWYMNASDSLKMWQQYAPKNGVAIQSTVRRFASCLQACQTPVTIGPVTYFAPEEEEEYIDEAFYGSLFIKHDFTIDQRTGEPIEFWHERELRALAYRVNVGYGVDIPINLESLIQRLVLSPELKDWAIPVVTETVRRFGFGGCVEKSSLNISD